MPGRRYTAGNQYRYGFNGKENDNDVKGEGNQQDYGMRIYDPRMGRFLSVDPLSQEYPWYSPYQFAGNKPIWAIDLDGAEEYYQNEASANKQQAMIRLQIVEQKQLYPQGSFRTKLKGWTTKWQESNSFFPMVTYSIVNGVYTTSQQLTSSVTGQEHIRKIGGGYYSANGPNGEKERTENFVNAATLFIPTTAAESKGAGIISKTLASFEGNSNKILSKVERLKILQTKLAEVAPAANQDEAIKLINNTLDNVEDAYSGVPKQKGIPTVDDGRMYGILDDKFVTMLEDGTKIANQRNNRIVLHKDGGFQIQSKDGKQTYFTKPGAQTK